MKVKKNDGGENRRQNEEETMEKNESARKEKLCDRTCFVYHSE